MTFFRRVVNDHLTEVLEAHKKGKITTEKALAKIVKASEYLANNHRYEFKKARNKDKNNKVNTDINKG